MKWGYKTVHFELKKEGLLGSGFLDESEIEQELNEFGASGWELVSVLEVQDGIIVFFKQPFTAETVHVAPQVEEEETDDHHDPVEQVEDVQQEEEGADEAPAEDSAVKDASIMGAIKIE